MQVRLAEDKRRPRPRRPGSGDAWLRVSNGDFNCNKWPSPSLSRFGPGRSLPATDATVVPRLLFVPGPASPPRTRRRFCPGAHLISAINGRLQPARRLCLKAVHLLLRLPTGPRREKGEENTGAAADTFQRGKRGGAARRGAAGGAEGTRLRGRQATGCKRRFLSPADSASPPSCQKKMEARFTRSVWVR